MFQIGELSISNLLLFLIFIASGYLIKHLIQIWSTRLSQLNLAITALLLRGVFHGLVVSITFFHLINLINHLFLSEFIRQETLSTITSILLITLITVIQAFHFRIFHDEDGPEYFTNAIYEGRGRGLIVLYIFSSVITLALSLEAMVFYDEFRLTESIPHRYLYVISFHILIIMMLRDFEKNFNALSELSAFPISEHADNGDVKSISFWSDGDAVLKINGDSHPIRLCGAKVPAPFVHITVKLDSNPIKVIAKLSTFRKKPASLSPARSTQIIRLANRNLKTIESELQKEGFSIKLPRLTKTEISS